MKRSRFTQTRNGVKSVHCMIVKADAGGQRDS